MSVFISPLWQSKRSAKVARWRRSCSVPVDCSSQRMPECFLYFFLIIFCISYGIILYFFLNWLGFLWQSKGGESEAELFCSSGLLVATHAGSEPKRREPFKGRAAGQGHGSLHRILGEPIQTHPNPIKPILINFESFKGFQIHMNPSFSHQSLSQCLS